MTRLATNATSSLATWRRRVPGDRRLWLLLISLVILALDQWTKWLVATHVALDSTITIIPNVFEISHAENIGAAFSLFGETSSPERVRWTLFAFSILAALIVLGMLLNIGRRMSATSVGLAMILAGALGNAYDRMHFGYVIDFLAVQIVRYHWPDFNVADSAIVVGALLLFYDAVIR